MDAANVNPLYEQLMGVQSQDTGILPFAAKKLPEMAADVGQRYGADQIKQFRETGAQGLLRAAQEAGVPRPERFFQMGMMDYEKAEAALAQEVSRVRKQGYGADIARRKRDELQQWLDQNPTATEDERVGRMRQMGQDLGAEAMFQDTPEGMDAVRERSSAMGAGGGWREELSRERLGLSRDRLAQQQEEEDRRVLTAEKNRTELANKRVESAIVGSGLQKVFPGIATLAGSAESITEVLQSVMDQGGEEAENLSILFTPSDHPSYQSFYDTAITRLSRSDFVQSNVRALMDKYRSEEDVAAESFNKKLLEGLESSDAVLRTRSAIFAFIVNYLKEVSGAAVTASEASRLFDGVLNRGEGFTTAIHGINELMNQKRKGAEPLLSNADARIQASRNPEAIEIWADLKGNFETTLAAVQIPPELIARLEEFDRKSLLRNRQIDVADVAPNTSRRRPGREVAPAEPEDDGVLGVLDDILGGL